MTDLRARVVAAVCLAAVGSIGLAAVFSTPSFPVADNLGMMAVAMAGFAALGGWSWRYGPAAGEVAFIASVVGTLVVFVVGVTPNQQRGVVAATEMGCIVSGLLAAAFAARRSGVVLVVGLDALAMVWLVWLRLHAEQFVIGLLVDLGVLVMSAGTVRALQEVAVAALRAASRGEVTDPLTGLANRRGLERYGSRLWRSRGHGGRVAVVVVDIDHFKRINDTRGHAAGDQVIQDLASVLAASVRDGDVVVRLGGEEFLLLMTLTAAGDAVRLAEEVRARVEEQLQSVTVSIGVHEAVPDPDDPLPTALWRALDLADRALYEAKRSGRNRVVSAAS